ncbi:hypothetical protein [Anaerosporobacter faecicola]|uniref:hypothetical protein n=1 Tax=Anaerosporobacter faecicola TaxID=2718714 RepID=UPI00143C21F2|nr:hypothetical protein [Anaerosporobacter faecicola]
MDNITKELNDHISEAEKGRQIWIQYCDNYKIDSQTLVVLMPEHDWKYNEIALKHMEQYCFKKKLKKKVILTVDNTVIEKYIQYSSDANAILVDDEVADDILQFYCLYDFTPNLVIASLEKPYGRKGKGCVGKNKLSLEEVATAMWYEIYL